MQCAQHSPEHSAYRWVMQPAYPVGVKNPSLRHQTRQANLLLLIGEAGGVTALGLLADTPKSYVSAMASGARGVGDEMAARLERVLDKRAGWMDRAHDSGTARFSPRALLLAEMLDEIPDKADRDQCAAFCESMAHLAQAGELAPVLKAFQALSIGAAPTPSPAADRLLPSAVAPTRRT